ncbi:MAG: tolB protein precursor, partial [Pedobacter sp.]|nr:tolB protein precursor [Pedobacter sp.]
PLNLSILDLDAKNISTLPVFTSANNLNPQFSGDSKTVYFLSNRDGFRNLYSYTLESKQLKQLTDYFTGISGITEFSPAISVSRNDDIVYSYYRSQRYTLYNAPASSFKAKDVDAKDVNLDAAILPPLENSGVSIVNANLANFDKFDRLKLDSIKPVHYRPQFKLDYLANSGVGVSTSRFGTGVQGGIVGMFSDILGKNQIVANLSVNGEVYDFGGLVGYVNQASRVNWGFAISHIPYLTGFRDIAIEELPTSDPNTTIPVYNERTNIIRTFENQAQLFAAYPFNKIHRFEAGSAISKYSYRVDRISNYYENIGGFVGNYLGSDRKHIDSQQASDELGISLKSFSIFQLNAAFIGDNSIFGLTAPLEGFRYRVGGEQYFGDYRFSAVNGDVRKYVRTKPFTFAARALTYMRLGKGGENLYPLYLGYPYLIRGYEATSIYNRQSDNTGNFDINQLSGSKIAVVNFEVRLPFTGPKKLAQIPSRIFFTDLNLFFDAGVAWDEDSHIVFKSQPNGVLSASGRPEERVPALSAGVSLRVNMFGYFVLEPYYAFPFQRRDVKAGVFGLTFAPGW